MRVLSQKNTHTSISQHRQGKNKISAHRQREQTRKKAVRVLGEPSPTLTTGAECTTSSLCSAARIERGSSNLVLHEIFLPPRRRDGCGLGTGFALRPDEVHGAPSRLRGGLTVARPRRRGAAPLRVQESLGRRSRLHASLPHAPPHHYEPINLVSHRGGNGRGLLFCGRSRPRMLNKNSSS